MTGAPQYGTELNRANVARFDPVEAQVLRVEAILKPTSSGGILELAFS